MTQNENNNRDSLHHLIPTAWNFVYALFIPLGVLILTNTVILRSTPQKHEATYLPFLISIVVTSLLTDILKNAVGRPRPDLLARCLPSKDAPTDRPVDISVCTTDPGSHLLQDGWRSFPSGHSSFSFAGLGFTALFLAGQLGVFAKGGRRDLSRALLCLVPILGATMIAVSRCEDYRHDVYDVCVGSALGMTVAYWSYRRYWPHMSSPHCHEPFPHPGSAEADSDGGSWQRVRDEEEAAGGDLSSSPRNDRV
jgi:diacylglycerol diphosphate phosphatase/phosphatidate phosphatase